MTKHYMGYRLNAKGELHGSVACVGCGVKAKERDRRVRLDISMQPRCEKCLDERRAQGFEFPRHSPDDKPLKTQLKDAHERLVVLGRDLYNDGALTSERSSIIATVDALLLKLKGGL
jgi:hypothetical protein